MARLSRKLMQLFAIAVAIILATVAALRLCVPLARINQSACDQIQLGMTVDEAGAVIGGPPGWYDGVWGVRTDAPPPYKDQPSWIGSQGEIILRLDAEGRVAEAQFYPGQVLNRSFATFLWERLTRNAFGTGRTGRTDRVVEAANGVFTGLLVTFPFVVAAFFWWRGGAVV